MVIPSRRTQHGCSWDRAFVLKTKKPLDLGFLDFSTVEKRKEKCVAEVRLNARLAPGVYLGVVPILTKDGATFVDDADIDSSRPAAAEGARLEDHGVKMRRLADEDRADVLLREQRLTPTLIDRLARSLAEFHHGCERSAVIDQFGTVEVIERNVFENFEQAAQVPAQFFGASPIEAVAAYQKSFLKDHAKLFAGRMADGFIRDGHGDLRLEHVYFEGDEVLIIDCIEFNERYRYADVACDLAFLSMDLRRLAGEAAAERLLARYAWITRDFQLYSLIDFYESYRAFVRAKVTALRSTQFAPGEGQALLKEVERYGEQAAGTRRFPSTRPRLICVGGLIASGKSTICQRLRQATCPVVIDSDHTRKYLHGIHVETPQHVSAFEGLYHPAQSDAVYARMAEDARYVVSSGRSVVIEASFSRRSNRDRFRALATELGADLYFVECHVTREVAQERLKKRAKNVTVSDGRSEIYDSFARIYESINAEEFERFVSLDTSQNEAAQNEELQALDLFYTPNV